MRATVLIVNPDAAALARQVADVQEAGFGVIGVSAFVDARALLKARRPDVLLTTLRIGAYNGIHLAMLARMMHGPVPTIITGEADVVLQGEAERAGATWLEAPVRTTDVLPAIWGAAHRDGRSLVRVALAGASIANHRGEPWQVTADTLRAACANN